MRLTSKGRYAVTAMLDVALQNVLENAISFAPNGSAIIVTLTAKEINDGGTLISLKVPDMLSFPPMAGIPSSF